MIYLVTTAILPETNLYKVITVEESLKLLRPLKIVGLDTETMGFDPHTKQLLMVQLGGYDFQVVIDCTSIDIKQYKEYLESDRLFVGWNLKFDLKFLYHHRIVPRNVWDGFLAEKLMWLGYPSGMHAMSLKAAGENYLGVELDKTVRGKIMWAGLRDDVVKYAANDVKYLERIMDCQKVQLAKQGLSTAVAYENKSVLWVAKTEYDGVLVSEGKWSWKMVLDNFTEQVFLDALNDWVVASVEGRGFAYHYLQIEGLSEKDLAKARKGMKGERCPEKDIKGARRGYFEAYKIPIEHQLSEDFVGNDLAGTLFEGFDELGGPKCIVNWNSSKQVIPLFKQLGFDLLARDKNTGEMKDSIEAKVIEPQADKSTIAYLYIQYKAATKVTSTYGQNVLNQRNEATGRIHTNFNQLGTDTGRLSSGGKDKVNKIDYLNFQNFPADNETRACFISSPGMRWISCDYSGQESRIIADVTNDKALLDLFNYGDGDAHSLVAKMAYPDKIGDCPVEQIKEKHKHWRGEAKGVEFAINYGGNANTISNNKGIPIEEAQKIYDSYMQGFKGMKAYQDRQRKFVMEHGFILLNPLSQHKAYIYDYDKLMKMKARFTYEFWAARKPYKGKQGKHSEQVIAQICDRFAKGVPIEEMTGTYTWVQETKRTKGEPKRETIYEVVTLADAYNYPVKHFFKRKSASEKQAINYPCQGGACALNKSRKFGESCDANTEPSLIVILRRCND